MGQSASQPASGQYGGFSGFRGATVLPASNNPQFAQMLNQFSTPFRTNHAANFGMINQSMPAPGDNRYFPWMLQGFNSQQAAQAGAPAPLSQPAPQAGAPAPSPAQGGIAALPGGYAFDWQANIGGGAG